MNSNIEQLAKILELENARGYSNTAVIGGLDSFLARCAEGAIKDAAGILLPGPGYAALNKKQRQEWAKRVLKQLGEGEISSFRRRKGREERTRITEVTAQSSTASRKADNRSLGSPITVLKGVNAKLAAKFAKLGVCTVHDLLYFFPHRHNDFGNTKFISQLEVGAEQTIVAAVWGASAKTIGKRMRSTEAIVGDETGNIRVVWFNQPYLAKSMRTNTRLVISGKVSLFKGQKVFESPEWELLESNDLVHTGRLIPVYSLTQGMSARTMRRLIKETVDLWAPRVPDFLPQEVRGRAALVDLPKAIMQAHYPDSIDLKDKARRRLAFDELFLIQLGMLAQKRDWQEGQAGNSLQAKPGLLESFLTSLPYDLTLAQQRVLSEIIADLDKPRPMSRLLQGDVGSGKTVVAAAALLVAVASGYQGVLMAPTEILAEQHFKTLSQLLTQQPVTIALLTGSMRKNEKQEVYYGIAREEIDIIIGTHALIQEGVEFKQLGLAVIDEQHRFGVRQRSALRQKGFNPHVLIMTATPIPRTLALTLYGDLDLSVIDQLPPGRQEIKTRWLAPHQRQSAYKFLRQQVAEGRQAFIICPLIEESETIEAKAATTEYERLCREVFPDLRLGLLHGRMTSSEKDEVMQRFRAGELDILVSTPVVEVGIDVPNATVMLVEGADRFGLSQLHQFRGRVGRGEHQSYCLLLAETASAEGRERLSLLERTQDGFALAEEDLRMRGPGEFFGTRQSGLPDLRMAQLSDLELLELARQEAVLLFERDPSLKQAEHELLAQELARLWKAGTSEMS